MNNEESHDKEKKKGKPRDKGETLKFALKCVLALFILGSFLACGFYIARFVDSLVGYPPFSPEGVTKTCSVLALSLDSAFCSNADQQTMDGLKTAIDQTYPPGSITISELRTRFSVDIQCDTQSMERYPPYCIVYLPLNGETLFIEHDKKDHILDYGIVDWEGSSIHR